MVGYCFTFMKIASAVGMDSNMLPPTWETPLRIGAVATCGKSKLVPLMCGCVFTISTIIPHVPPRLQEKSLLARVKFPRKNSNIVAKSYYREHMALEGHRICYCC